MPRPGPHSHEEWQAAWAERHPDTAYGAGWGGPPWGGPPWGGGPPAWRLPPAITLWVPVVLSFLVQVPAAIWIARSTQAEPPEAVLSILLALVGPLALIGARRWPGPVVAVTALAASADLILDEHGGPPYLALAFGILSAVVRGARLWAWISVGVCWVAAITIALLIGQQPWTPWRIAGTTLGLLLVFGIGEGIRTRRERVAEFRRRVTQRRQTAEQAERVRIARELHDVIAHSLSQINVQAGVGLHLMDTQPEQARAALANIKETSKTSLDEVRSVLGMLRADDGDGLEPMLVPQPDLDRLRLLATGTGALEVAIDDQLDHSSIPQGVQSAVFRIVQESITNTVRHAEGATRVDVTLETDGDAVRVEVRDDGTGSRESSADGKGLLGMRERAELLGGTLEAGAVEGGGFRVVAELPLPNTVRGAR